MTAGDTSATLTLAYNDMDFDTNRTLGVTVAAAAHALPNTIVSPSVQVTPSLEATATPDSLGLTEATTGGGNARTFTVVLDSLPASDTTVAVASADTGAARVDKAALTFTTVNWATAQSVTVTAQQDDDTRNESTTVTLSAAGVGTLATVTVTVTDDDRGRVLIDIDASTPAQDPGPILLDETSTPICTLCGGYQAYTVRLSTQPTAAATVAISASEANKVWTVSAIGGQTLPTVSSLTFTTQNWSTAQTVYAVAVNEADAVDESVTFTHAATGGGYGGTSTVLRVGVTDDERTGTDYDVDNDGLIEVSTLAQLNAIRWDLDGNGSPASNAADYSGASGAFANASTDMGCPAVSGTATCEGYELTQDLDFDTDGDGASHDGGTSDSGDTYHNGGSGWDPIGRSWSPSDATHFNAVFDGNGHSIHNLYVNRNRNYGGLFAVLRGSAVVRSLGLPNAYVDISQQGSAAPLAGSSWGRVEASWASGSVAGNTNVGGLVGVDGGEFGDRGQLLEGSSAVRRRQRRRAGGRQRRNHRRQLRDRGDHGQLRGDQQARPGRLHRHGRVEPLGPRDERRHHVRPGRRPHHGAAEDADVGHRHLRRLGGHGRGRRRQPARIAVALRHRFAVPGAVVSGHGCDRAVRRLRHRRQRPDRSPHSGAVERHPLGSERRRHAVVGQRQQLQPGVPQPRRRHGLLERCGGRRRTRLCRLRGLRTGERSGLRHGWRRVHVDPGGRHLHPRQRRRLPQRRQRLGSHRPELGAERQHPLQCHVRRQGPRHRKPDGEPQPQLRRPVRVDTRQRCGRAPSGCRTPASKAGTPRALRRCWQAMSEGA